MNRCILQNEQIKLVVLPERGGKLASLTDAESGLELLAQPRDGVYPPLAPHMPFDDAAASGFDDVFPSMGEPARANEWQAVPDHGFIWSSPMRAEREPDGLTLSLNGSAWRYEKRVRLNGNRALLDWRIQNIGERQQPFLWVCHCLWRLENDMRFFMPTEAAVDVLDALEPPAAMPQTVIASGAMIKRYLAKPVGIGECGFVWPSAGLRVTMRFEGLEWLGFWMSNGGWHGARQFAFEPATGYYDTLARAQRSGTLQWFLPGEERRFAITLQIEKEARI